MKFNNKLPIYVQISKELKKQIAARKLKQGSQLLSVRDFSTKVKANPNTVSKAYSELEQENLVYTQRGLGTFVTDDSFVIKKLRRDMANQIVHSYIKDMNAIGFTSDELIMMVKKQTEEEIK